MDNKTYHLYTDEEKLEIIKDHIAQLGMTIDCSESPTVPDA